jgi:hypothetical protein
MRDDLLARAKAIDPKLPAETAMRMLEMAGTHYTEHTHLSLAYWIGVRALTLALEPTCEYYHNDIIEDVKRLEFLVAGQRINDHRREETA